jgi:hypothetical protein
MKKLLFIISFLACLSGSVFAQEGNNDQDGSRLEALKIAYLTKKLNLSPQEAQRFWPVYNNYAAEIRQVKQEQRNNKVSELAAEEKLLQIRKKYNAEFSKAISPEKVNNFFRSEKDFGGYVQKELLERRQIRELQLNKDRIRR